MTPTDTHDPFDEELALPAFEDALWAALRAEHARTRRRVVRRDRASGVVGGRRRGTAADPPIVVPVDAPRRRHRALRRGLAAAAVVAVLAGVGAVVADDGDDPRTVAGPSTTDAPTTTSAPAPLEDRIVIALDEAAAASVTATEERRGGVLVQQSWGDDVSGGRRILRYGEDEKALFDLGPADAPLPGGARLVEVVLRAVDHCFRQWSVAPGALIGGPLGDLARAVERGDLQPDGTAVVEDRELLVLRPVARSYEVDPETGLPDLDGEPARVRGRRDAGHLPRPRDAPARAGEVGDRDRHRDDHLVPAPPAPS